MIDDLLELIFEDVAIDAFGKSKRVQLLFRLFFGLIGAGLGAAGAIYFGGKADLTANAPMRWSMIGLFVFLACFSLFNVALARPWRWPGKLFLLSLAALFVTRFAFGP